MKKLQRFPHKKYSIIYADPPWKFEEGFWGRSKSNPSLHYSVMPTNEICNLPVKSIAQDNCHLYIWTTSSHLLNGDVIKVIKSWGFRPMNIITWCKCHISLGYYFRNSTEHLLFGIKGHFHTLDRKQGTYMISARKKHSEKPHIFRKLIVKCSDLPRIELFARERFEGWDAWGGEGQLSDRIHTEIWSFTDTDKNS